MYGHLRMGHGLRGDELEETYEQTQQTQEQAQEQGRATVTETEDSESESLGASLPPVPSSPSDEGREAAEDRRTTEDRKPVQKAETNAQGDRVWPRPRTAYDGQSNAYKRWRPRPERR